MNDLVDRIASGKATLLGIEDICTRLGVSRTTFDRWLKNWLVANNKASQVTVLPQVGPGAVGLRQFLSRPLPGEQSDSAMQFPPADIRIGNSPKWELATFKNWLLQNSTIKD